VKKRRQLQVLAVDLHVIRRLMGIRRERVAMAGMEFLQVTTLEHNQQQSLICSTSDCSHNHEIDSGCNSLETKRMQMKRKRRCVLMPREIVRLPTRTMSY
jgi:hypothetical protein